MTDLPGVLCKGGVGDDVDGTALSSSASVIRLSGRPSVMAVVLLSLLPFSASAILSLSTSILFKSVVLVEADTGLTGGIGGTVSWAGAVRDLNGEQLDTRFLSEPGPFCLPNATTGEADRLC